MAAFWLQNQAFVTGPVAVHLTAVYVCVGKITTDLSRDLGSALVAKSSDLGPDPTRHWPVFQVKVVTCSQEGLP